MALESMDSICYFPRFLLPTYPVEGPREGENECVNLSCVWKPRVF